MTISAPTGLPRVTYSNVAEDFSGVHAFLDAAIPDVRERLLDRDWNNYIGGRENSNGEAYDAFCPIDRSIRLGTFMAASDEAVDLAVRTARTHQKAWYLSGWKERARIMRSVADVLERRKWDIAIACLFEVGKSRMEAIGEVEEAIDIIRFYSNELEANQGFTRSLARANQNEETIDVLRPYGVFGIIAPFNFPVALSIGMSVSAMLAGNAVVFKPSPMAGLTGRLIVDCYVEGGVPAGIINLVCGGNNVGATIARHPGIDGIAFTGSHQVGMEIMRNFGTAGAYMRPVLAELGGKNPAYICETADIGVAVSGLARSAFGLQGQKCSACSVAFVHDAVYDDVVQGLKGTVDNIVVGEPTEKQVFMGPLINEKALKRFEEARDLARRSGATIVGGERLYGGLFDKGSYVRPLVALDLPDDHPLHQDELFLPFLTVRRFSQLGDAIRRGNAVRYGLTAGIYTMDDQELSHFLETAEAGALYANRASGATTGAWPGVQTFCGWKGSGTGSKGGLGTWYLPQFMREQSHTVMRSVKL